MTDDVSLSVAQLCCPLLSFRLSCHTMVMAYLRREYRKIAMMSHPNNNEGNEREQLKQLRNFRIHMSGNYMQMNERRKNSN
ncbi:hypothetical protein Bca101_056811 [Brassica carinata]